MAGAEETPAASFMRFGSISAILAGVMGLLYSVAFVAWLKVQGLSPDTRDMLVGLYSTFLLLGAVFTGAALLAFYFRLRETDAGFALWGLVLGTIGAFGALVHGGYDLGTLLTPATGSSGASPNQTDPRGLLTFGVAGLGLFVMSWLASRNPHFPKNFAYLGYLAALLLVIIYLGRLIIQDPNNLLLTIPAILAGLIVNPAWYIWLGTLLRREA
jgi:hypothetical protein